MKLMEEGSDHGAVVSLLLGAELVACIPGLAFLPEVAYK